MSRLSLPVLALALSLSVALLASGAESETKTLVWPDGTRYVGGVKDGKRDGKGTIFWKDGTRFIGTFEDDKRSGPGTMILPDGTVYNGYFKDDELVEAPAEPGAPEAEVPARIAGTQPAAGKDDEPAQEPAMPGASPVTTMTDAVRAELRTMVELWAASWSEQNVVQYLDYYSDDFEVPGRQSRSSWEALRRSRLTRPSRIDVDLEFQDFEIIEPDIAEVSFRQTYDSNLYSDVTDKVLRLRHEGHYWRIVRETSR